MKRLIFLIALIATFPAAVFAHEGYYSTRLQINAGSMIHYNDTNNLNTILRNVGFRASFKPIRWLSVNFSYNKMVDWDVWFNDSREEKNGITYKRPDPIPNSTNILSEGFTVARFNYETYDLHINYVKTRKSHELLFGAGACYTRGIDKVTPRKIVFTSASDPIETKDVANNFWGPMVNFTFNQLFFKKQAELWHQHHYPGIFFRLVDTVFYRTEYWIQL